ncbi:ParB/RepB/Spo0J family partition protein [Aestuariivita sp.]|jgi:ParB family chromosome partitioning protein|uniref:ParB/RepB/Spo0J family partition protein n=1 Tax=Aestuariivita sp. TaxID=1872407 RepID=UPI00216C4933|nr:ParB/RepB/Spo0J family partition protein [Aestuariivita sp.]MCE8005510.1 ParB/RepB/Spo0J family partition protein [Aestuariivita sp.]
MADKKSKARGLGRGLSALMADVPTEPVETQAPRPADQHVPIEKVEANPDQPRRRFSKEALDELTASVREKGIIQPLIVRVKGAGYEIVAGERRWRAAQQAQLHEVPVIVRDFDDTEVLEVAIIENIQRADLNPVEEAAGYRQLMDRFGHTQEKLAEALGKSRSHIANLMRLLTLPDVVQEMLQEGHLSAGHARALITSDDPISLAQMVVKKGLSVRETEKLAKSQTTPRTRPTRTAPEKDADTKALEGDLSATLGLNVQIEHRPGQEAGQITIKYESLEDLDTLCRLLSGS